MDYVIKMYEYKICQRQLVANSLENELNKMSNDEWELHILTSDDIRIYKREKKI